MRARVSPVTGGLPTYRLDRPQALSALQEPDPVVRAQSAGEWCKQATNAVAGFAPVGIGHWDPAFSLTDEADREFTRALIAWEAAGSLTNQVRVRVAFEDFLGSWRHAVCRYELGDDSEEKGPFGIIDGRDRARIAFRIPAQKIRASIQLDPERVAAITKESEAVCAALREVCGSEEAEIPQAGDPRDNRGDSLGGLDKQHRDLLAVLLTRPTWTASELDHAAKRVGLLGSGAVERINEMAFEDCGEPLLEGRDPIEINGYAVKAMETT